MSSITDNQAAIIALLVESVCYGIYLVTLGLCLRTLLWERRGGGLKPWSQVNRLMLAICLIMPITATINLCLNVVRAVESASPSGVSKQFTDLGSPQEVTKFFCVDFQTLIADFMLTYRCWVIYGKSWIMAALPTFLWFGVLSTTILNLVVLRQTHDQSLTAETSLRPIITSFWAISIALNIFTTSLIILRVYRLDKELALAHITRVSSGIPSGNKRKYSWLKRITRIIVESGVLYTSGAVATCITYATGSQGIYVASAIEMQTVGIAFNLIIIRVAMTPTNSPSYYSTKTGNTTIPLRIVARPQNNATSNLEISVTQETHDDVPRRNEGLGKNMNSVVEDEADEFKYRHDTSSC